MFAVHADIAVLDPRLPARSDIAVLVVGGRIVDVGPAASLLPAPGGDLPVTHVQILMPGMVDAHSHGRGHTLEQQDLAADADLLRLLLEFTTHTPVPGLEDAVVASAGLVATGVTAARVVHHSFAGAPAYSAQLTDVTAGLLSSGLSVTMALGITDRDEYLPASADPALPSGLRSPPRGLSADGWRELVTGVVRGSRSQPVTWEVAPVNPRWCSPSLLTDAAALARDLGIGVHTHLLEVDWQRGTPAASGDLRACLEAGLVGDRFSAAHAVWLRREEITQIAERGGSLIHCPVSNCRLHVGTAAVRSWLDAGIPVAIGLDSITDQHPDMFATLRAAVQVAEELGRPVSATEMLVAATVGGARSLGDPTWTGVIEPGTRADLVAVDRASSPETVPADLVHRTGRDDVQAVWGGGRLLYQRGQRADAAVAFAAARVQALLLEDADRRRAALARVGRWMPQVRAAWAGDLATEHRPAPRPAHTRSEAPR